MTEKIQSIPEAKLLLASLRSVGYNEETAIADIVDNSISAQAHEIISLLVWIEFSLSYWPPLPIQTHIFYHVILWYPLIFPNITEIIVKLYKIYYTAYVE